MPYTKVSEATASLWMTKDFTRVQFPLDGQGAVLTGVGSSLIASAGPSHPVIIEAIMVDGVTGIDRDIRIVDASANVLYTINVKATATEVSQYIKIGGTFGLRLNQPFGVRVDSTGNSALPITGINYIGKVHVFFRYD